MLDVIKCSTIQGKPRWRKLLEAYTFEDVTVPIDEEWNGASTPWFAKCVIPKFELVLEASCVHDWECKNAKTKAERKRADERFERMLKIKGKHLEGFDRQIFKARIKLGFWGVRIGAFFNINGSKASWK